VAEYLALVETERGYDELIEGRRGLRCLLDLGPLPSPAGPGRSSLDE
jgi:hypothetical protein